MFLSRAAGKLTWLALLFIGAVLLPGCGRWSPDRYEQAAVEHIDGQLQMGMSLEAFRKRYPSAVALEVEGGRERYLIAHNSVCLLCRTGQGFLVSEDMFARLVSFESDQLVAIEAVHRAAR